MDCTKFWTDQRDTFVCPDHVEQVVFKADPKDPKWLFVVQVAPRSKQVCEGLDVDDEHDESPVVDEQPQQALEHEVGHHEADGVVQEDHVDEDVEVQVPEQFNEDNAVLVL